MTSKYTADIIGFDMEDDDESKLRLLICLVIPNQHDPEEIERMLMQ